MNQSKGLNGDQNSEHNKEKNFLKDHGVAKSSFGKNDLEKEPLFGTPQDQT